MSKPVDNFCPACAVEPGQTCRNLVTGKPMYRDGRPVTHPARIEAPWQDPVLLRRRQDLREANLAWYAAES